MLLRDRSSLVAQRRPIPATRRKAPESAAAPAAQPSVAVGGRGFGSARPGRGRFLLERLTLAEMEEFVTTSRQVTWSAVDPGSVYKLIERVLKAQQYRRLSKGQRGMVKRFPRRTGDAAHCRKAARFRVARI